MSIDYNGIMNELFSKGLIIAGVVAKSDGKILYCSSNWSVEQDDLKKCISGWQKRGQFVKLQGIKYSMLLSQPDYFSTLNYKDKTWLVGASSPPDAGDPVFVLGYAPLVMLAYRMKKILETRGTRKPGDQG